MMSPNCFLRLVDLKIVDLKIIDLHLGPVCCGFVAGCMVPCGGPVLVPVGPRLRRAGAWGEGKRALRGECLCSGLSRRLLQPPGFYS